MSIVDKTVDWSVGSCAHVTIANKCDGSRQPDVLRIAVLLN